MYRAREKPYVPYSDLLENVLLAKTLPQSPLQKSKTVRPRVGLYEIENTVEGAMGHISIFALSA